MTQTAAICQALLEGKVLSIMTGFQMFSCTNLPRELSRSIEQKFDVTISKSPTKFTSKYGQSGQYYRYRLNTSEHNLPGIEKMRSYVAEQKSGNKNGNNPAPERKLIQKDLFQ